MRRFAWLVVMPIIAVLVGVSFAAFAPKEIPKVKGIVFCQVPDLPNGRSGLGMEQFRIVQRPANARICSLIPAEPTGEYKNLTPNHVSAMQPDLSYDARKVIFTAKKTPQDKWNIWEMNVDGTGQRQITQDMEDCIDPCYLPDGKILFSSGKPNFRDEYDRDVAKLLYTCNPDGSNPVRITFNLSSDTASIVLHDGRLLFTTWQHHGNHQGVAGIFAFGVCNPDGTVFMPFYGNQSGEGANTKSYAQQLVDGRIVYVESAGHRLYNSGALASLRPENPYRSRKLLTLGQTTEGTNLAGRYASPYPLPDGGMICSYSPGRGTGPLQMEYTEDIRLGIYHFDFAAGRAGKLIFDDPRAQDYDAIAIYPRPVPPVIPSLVQPHKKTGTFLCVNSYLSDRKPSPNIVVGQLPPAKPGEIKAVRVVEGFGVEDKNPKKHRALVIDILQMSFGSGSNGGNVFEQKKILGYAPVETDGSFHVEVPADTVLNLQTLDENDMAIETQLTWVWVRPGEKRFCVGCHESRETALPNLDCMAMAKAAPHVVAPPPEKRRTVDFRRDIMPIIQTKCATAQCHGAKPPAGGLDFGGGSELVFHRKGCTGRPINAAFFNRAYESLLQGGDGPHRLVGRLVIPSAARHSPLIWRLYGKQLAQGDARVPYKGPLTPMPPPSHPPLTPAEKKLFVEWVDIGAQWDNIPGEDDLPGYDEDQSKALAKAAQELVAKPISDPKAAFETRCTECHDFEYITKAKARKKAESEWLESITRMVAKRPAWFHESEMPLITQYVLDNYFQKPK